MYIWQIQVLSLSLLNPKRSKKMTHHRQKAQIKKKKKIADTLDLLLMTNALAGLQWHLWSWQWCWLCLRNRHYDVWKQRCLQGARGTIVYFDKMDHYPDNGNTYDRKELKWQGATILAHLAFNISNSATVLSLRYTYYTSKHETISSPVSRTPLRVHVDY